MLVCRLAAFCPYDYLPFRAKLPLLHVQDKKLSKRERSPEPERPTAEPPRAAGPRAPLVLDDSERDSKRQRHDRNEVRLG